MKWIIFVLFCLLVTLVSASGYGSGSYSAGVYVGDDGSVEEEVEEIVASPSSGGGGSSCSYDWECTSWFPAECPKLGVQERICVNKGDCSGVVGMPSETRLCNFSGPTEPLFDIFVTLLDEEVCGGSDIGAKIKLENFGKVELLDAFMTYWIVDENNSLIVEVKDTRAVDGLKEFEVELKVPSFVGNGTYRFYAQVNYDGNKTALAGESFEVVSKESCGVSFGFDFWIYFVYGLILVLVLIVVGVLVKMFRKRERKVAGHAEYVRRIKRGVGRIRSGRALVVVAGLFGLFLIGSRMVGFAVSSLGAGGSVGVLMFVLVVGALILFRGEVRVLIEKVKVKFDKNSVRGLIGREVYSEEGSYVGKVEEVFLSERIDSLKVAVRKIRIKGFIVKFEDVISVGDVVIIKEGVWEIVKENL